MEQLNTLFQQLSLMPLRACEEPAISVEHGAMLRIMTDKPEVK